MDNLAMERELKYLLEHPVAPQLPDVFHLSAPEPTQHLVDEYIDDRGRIAASGHRLRRRHSDHAGVVYTLKSTGRIAGGPLFERTEIEVAAEPDESIPTSLIAELSRLGVELPHAQGDLQTSLILRQERHPATLFWRDQQIALLSVDQVRASTPALSDEHGWSELEIEYVPTVDPNERQLTAQLLSEWLVKQHGITTTSETKADRAARLLGVSV